MTMMTPERSTSGAADRLVKERMSSLSIDEEKKTADDGDYKKHNRAQEACSKQSTSSTTATATSAWRNAISNEPGSKYLPEKGRYVLYASRACPSAHRVLLVHSLKQLGDVVPVVYANYQGTIQYVMGDDSLASILSDHGGAFASVSDIYQKEGVNGNASMPLIYDKHNECIVNNNADDIARMFNDAFNNNDKNTASLSQNPTLDLFCENDSATQAKLADVKTWLYPLIQLAPSSTPPYHYHVSARELDFAFHRATTILSRQRYLTSHKAITEVDLSLFATLIRYEEVYSKFLLPGSAPSLLGHPVLLDSMRDIYQCASGVADTVHIAEIRAHYLGNSSAGGSSAMLSLLQMPHKRHLL